MSLAKNVTVKVLAEDNSDVEKNITITLVKAVLTAFNSTIVLTDETVGGNKISTKFTTNIVTYQGGYGVTCIGLIAAIKRSRKLTFEVTEA